MKFKTMRIEKNKKKIIIGVISVIITIIIVIIIKKSFAFKNEEDNLKRQVVEGLTFEKAKIEYEEGISKFTVEIYNDTEKEYEVKTIDIEFTNTEGEKKKLIGYIGEVIEKDEVKYLQASIEEDLSDTVDIRYIINH